MIDLKKLGRIGLDSGDQQKVDTVLNVDHRPLISPYNKKFIEHGFVEVKNDQYYIKMSKREKDVFQITKSIGDEETGFAYDVIGKLLTDKTEEDLRKEIDLVRDDAQVQILLVEKRQKELTRINIDHQKLNGELREDNKKLAKQVEDFAQKKVNGLRKGGVL